MKKYGLSNVIGFSKFRVNHSGSLDDENSLLRLWTFGVAPAMIFNQSLQSSCTQFLVTRSTLSVADIPLGGVTLDQISMSIPSSYGLQYLPDLSARDAECIVNWVNSAEWKGPERTMHGARADDSPESPYYVVPNNTYEN